MKRPGFLLRVGIILVALVATAAAPASRPSTASASTLALRSGTGAAPTVTASVAVAQGGAPVLARRRTACDLAVSQSVSGDTATINSSIVYYIVVLNLGAASAADVVVRDSVPVGTYFQYASSSRGSFGPDSSGVVNCPLGALAPGDSVVINLGLVAFSAGTVQNTASGTTSTFDSNLANNSFTRTVTVVAPQTADVFVTQSHAPDSPVAGTNLAYTIVVGNHGPYDAADVSMGHSMFNLPFTVVSVSPSRGICVVDTAGNVSCTFGTVTVGDSVRVDVVVVPGTDGVLYAYSSANTSTLDSDFSNNYAYTGLFVQPSAQQLLANLIALVKSYQLRKGVESNLVSPLQSAQKALAVPDTAGACSDLGTFHQRVTQFSGRGLTVAQAYQLDTQASGIDSVLHCGAAAAGTAHTATLGSLETPFSFRLISGLGEATTRAQLTMPLAGSARLDVFDISGRLVRTAWNGPLAAGTHDLQWDGRGRSGARVSPGMYFFRLTTAMDRAVARVLVLR